MKKCCFIGHRVIEVTEGLVLKLENLIIKLIEEGVTTFLFGSNSQFDDLCYKLVSKLQLKNNKIKKVAYSLKSEIVFSQEKKEIMQNLLIDIAKDYSYLKDYDEVANNERWVNSCKASYILRNKAMIDDSDYCVFFYNVNYNVTDKVLSNKMIIRKRESGTKQMYEYAQKKGKNIINLF